MLLPLGEEGNSQTGPGLTWKQPSSFRELFVFYRHACQGLVRLWAEMSGPNSFLDFVVAGRVKFQSVGFSKMRNFLLRRWFWMPLEQNTVCSVWHITKHGLSNMRSLSKLLNFGGFNWINIQWRRLTFSRHSDSLGILRVFKFSWEKMCDSLL